MLRAAGLIKVVQGPASRLRQRQPLGPAFDLLVIDKLFFDGTGQKQGHVKHLVPPEFSHVRHTVLPVLSRLPPAIMVVLPRLHVEKHRIPSPGPPVTQVPAVLHFLLHRDRAVTDFVTQKHPRLTRSAQVEAGDPEVGLSGGSSQSLRPG